ncbi:hypothetical protein B0H16DRAFT_1731973 [Mycena metata]|uniref:Uncharacterized protein n=1 Tax=Mycena metata TaxID=1033252 RepID=A0AAD7I484_9AGAR|nr:hypothetical protein B0H16DRAFT_1731973 [Mycena metata]
MSRPYSVSFSRQQGSGSELDVDGSEKPFTVLLPRSSRHFELGVFLSKLAGWPVIVIGGHLILQAAAWSFFAVVEARMFLALPYSSASWAMNHPHPITLVSTLISTVLAAASSFLFSWGLRQSIAIHLHRKGMSLADFISSVKISSRSLILEPRRWKWSAPSIALVILTGVQTSGWNALITPLPINVPTPLNGSELDLSSQLLQQMQSSGALDKCVYGSINLPVFTVGQTESGYGVVKDNLDFPSSLTLMDQTFNVNTAGILPLTLFDAGGLFDTKSSSWFPGTTAIPGTLKPLFELPDGLSSNYSTTQQGFTATVQCTFQDVSADTTPSATFSDATVKNWSTGEQLGNITFSHLTSDCLVPVKSKLNTTQAYTDEDDYILMIGCQSAENYTLIFEGSGLYDFMKTMVCTVSPQITTVWVDYSDSDPTLDTISIKNTFDSVPEPAGGPAGLSAVTTMSYAIYFAQGISSNLMGDELRSLLQEVSGGDEFADEDVLQYTGEYMRGIAEYSGTVLQHEHRLLRDFLHPDCGLDARLCHHLLGPLPRTLVALITISVVLLSVARDSAGDGVRPPFDPTNAMHLLAASAAGGLHDVFTGTEEKDIEAARDVNIVLESIPGRGPALTRSTL